MKNRLHCMRCGQRKATASKSLPPIRHPDSKLHLIMQNYCAYNKMQILRACITITYYNTITIKKVGMRQHGTHCFSRTLAHAGGRSFPVSLSVRKPSLRSCLPQRSDLYHSLPPLTGRVCSTHTNSPNLPQLASNLCPQQTAEDTSTLLYLTDEVGRIVYSASLRRECLYGVALSHAEVIDILKILCKNESKFASFRINRVIAQVWIHVFHRIFGIYLSFKLYLTQISYNITSKFYVIRNGQYLWYEKSCITNYSGLIAQIEHKKHRISRDSPFSTIITIASGKDMFLASADGQERALPQRTDNLSQSISNFIVVLHKQTLKHGGKQNG